MHEDMIVEITQETQCVLRDITFNSPQKINDNGLRKPKTIKTLDNLC